MAHARFRDDVYFSDSEQRRRHTSVVEDFRPSSRPTPAWLYNDNQRTSQQQIVVHSQPGSDVYARRPQVTCIMPQAGGYHDQNLEPDRTYPRRVMTPVLPQERYANTDGFHIIYHASEETSEFSYTDSCDSCDESEAGQESDFEHQKPMPRSASELAARKRSLSRSAVDSALRCRSASRPAPGPEQVPSVFEPTIEREVITHFTNIDHGTINARPQSQVRLQPPKTPRPRSQSRSQSHSRPILLNGNTIQIEIEQTDRPSRRLAPAEEPTIRISHPKLQRRASSAAPLLTHRDTQLQLDQPHNQNLVLITGDPDADEEAHEITARINATGRFGEAVDGITQDWSIVEVPPGTKRIRMDGAGGASAEVTWRRHSGARRARLVLDSKDEADHALGPASRTKSRGPDGRRRDRERDRKRDDVTIAVKPSRRQRAERWTEIAKELVSRSALRARGYSFKETDLFFHVSDYVGSSEMVELMALTKQIRRERRRMRKLNDGRGRQRRERPRELINGEQGAAAHGRSGRIHVERGRR
ncbi:hypothetical protein BROUX41_002976 [Berkeleyomyces rouxiae]|uniref:uncharacterized protein n=1 Tax=Berkeleyomyces rouxiae TaxID=2035830 RepID=UPI003B78E478